MHVDIGRIRDHVAALAASPRPAESPALDDARAYVARKLQQAGWEVEPHAFQVEAGERGLLRGVNLFASHPAHPLGNGPRFCVGAHLDSIPTSPGADDNASAVATLLEVARLLPENWPAEAQVELQLAAYDLEECGMLGGAEHARLIQQAGVDLRGMISLEMLGYCDPEPGSQLLPSVLAGMYPDTGDFIALIGNQNSGVLLDRFREGMRRVAALPVETLAVPANGEYLQATRLSDHSPFWDAGYAALMITDTSYLRNPYYHTPRDTLDTLDLRFLHLVAEGCCQAVRHVLETGL